MVVPSQAKLHRPLLEIASESGEALSKTQFLNEITVRLSLTGEDLAEKIPSGTSRLEKNIAYSVWHMAKVGLFQKPSRARFQITFVGREFLKSHDGMITSAMLTELANKQMPRGISNSPLATVSTDVIASNTESPTADLDLNSQFSDDTNPEDKIEDGYIALQEKLVDDILESISQISPEGFERLVVDLLEKMGYGKGEAVGKSSDGGIDGIINQDALGLEKVYMQAKRWQSQVGEPEIRNFSGSLDARGASKGVLVTTSNFSGNAKQTAQIISAGNKFIRLIDGPELAKLMLAHEVGVITQYTYKIQKLDENYFAEES